MSPRNVTRAHEAAKNLQRFFLCVLLTTQFASLFANVFWVFDLLRHFQAQYFLVAIGLLGLALVARTPRFLPGILLSLCFSGWNLSGLYLGGGSTSPEPSGSPHRLAVLNVYTANTRYDDVENYILREDPDLVFLMEVDSRWIENIERIKKAYPHQLVHPRDDNFGIALLSRTELFNAKIEYFEKSHVPVMSAELVLSGVRAQFLGVHTLPPVSKHHTRWRNRLLEDISVLVKNRTLPMIVAGDLNTTRWGVGFSLLTANGDLLNSENGFGYRPTWSGDSPLLSIPIDHVLTTKEMIVKKRSVGPDVGSDHRGVVVDFAL